MDAGLKTRLVELAGDFANDAQEQALMAFFYLVMSLATPLKERTGFKISTRSFLPVGAGLGSSASYSVVLATALLIVFDYIPVDFASSANSASYFETINRYAFKAEQVIHGNPSGVDNAVAAFGKSFLFQRESFDTNASLSEL
jgi:mevalonate kinase